MAGQGAVVEPVVGEEVDAAKNAPVDADPDGEFNPADVSDLNADPENQAPGEGDGLPGEAPEEGAVPEAPDPDERFNSIAEENRQLKERLEKLEQGSQQKQSEPVQLTEDQIQAIQEKSGLEYKSVQFMNENLAAVVYSMKQYIDSKFGATERSSAIEQFAKRPGFTDAMSLRAGMQKFLDEKIPADRHSDADVIEAAYYYAKGRGAGKAIKAAASGNERNKRIAGAGRPNSPTSGVLPGRTRPGAIKLTPEQDHARRAAGMSTAEYIKWMPKQ